MSCQSPFVYVESAIGTTQNFIFNSKGSYSLPGYTTPSKEICLLGINPGYANCWWGGWQNTVLNCSWVPGSTYWYDCSTIPGIPIWPELTFSYDCKINMTIISKLGVELTIEDPVEPFEVFAIQINSLPVIISINGQQILNLNLVSIPIQVKEENGQFAIVIPIGSFGSEGSYQGLPISLMVQFNLLFCLDPVPPVGWVNLQVENTFTIGDPSIDLDYETGYSYDIPLVSVEEVPE